MLLSHKNKIIIALSLNCCSSSCSMNFTDLTDYWSEERYRAELPQSVIEIDKKIEKEIRSELNKDREVAKRSSVKVYSFNQKLLIIGEAEDNATEALIGQIIDDSSNRDEFSVHNFIKIQPLSGLSSRIQDKIMQSAAEQKVANFNQKSNIKIIVNNKRIYIIGSLSKASLKTRMISDLGKVKKAKEIIDILY